MEGVDINLVPFRAKVKQRVGYVKVVAAHPSLVERLRACASREGVSMNALVRQAVIAEVARLEDRQLGLRRPTRYEIHDQPGASHMR